MDAERKSIYVETTIPSYATSRPSNDIVIAGRQALTRFFWEQERHKYDLFISRYVSKNAVVAMWLPHIGDLILFQELRVYLD
jgi:hypothetical protein